MIVEHEKIDFVHSYVFDIMILFFPIVIHENIFLLNTPRRSIVIYKKTLKSFKNDTVMLGDLRAKKVIFPLCDTLGHLYI